MRIPHDSTSTKGYKLRGRTEQRRYIGSRSIHYPNNASQLIEVEYLAATNGYLKLWLQDALVDPVNLENDTCAVTGMNRDAMWFIPTGTSGTIYFGTFEKRRGGYIGSLAIAAPLLAQKEPVSQYNASFQPAA